MTNGSLHSANHNTTTEYVDLRLLLPRGATVVSPNLFEDSVFLDESPKMTVETTEMIDPDLARDIYKNLRAVEMKNRPFANYIETVQTEIDADTRARLVEWLVELTEVFHLTSETLFLTVNYVDRFLSGNSVRRDRLRLLGTACILIASKHEEDMYPLRVDELPHEYSREEVLQMEADVLFYLKFVLTVPTVKCFLRGLVHAAQGPPELELLADYIAELSLLEYMMLCYSPSLVAASSVFLASFILQSAKHPWSATSREYAQYRGRELYVCVKDLHRLFCSSAASKFSAIKKKYGQYYYMFGADPFHLPQIPSVFFQDASD